MDLNSFRALMEKIAWPDSQGKPIKFQVESESSQHGQTLLAKLLFLLVVSLILVSGLINFLKFTIQMFFNRQRELALRKCLGSDTKGLYGLLASEVILMMTAALLLSFLLTEWTFGLAYSLLPMDEVPDIRLQDVYLTHGHQADHLNSTFWRVSRFLVRYIWRPLESLGIPDPTSAAKNNTRKKESEKKLSGWANRHGHILITGHTHHPMITDSGYLNTGSCVHPSGITGIEIRNRCLTLVKWSVAARQDLSLYARREILGEPVRLP